MKVESLVATIRLIRPDLDLPNIGAAISITAPKVKERGSKEKKTLFTV